MKRFWQSVTAFLFIAITGAAIVWVTWSYVLASYATIALGQPFPATELSEQVIVVLLGVVIAKVAANIWEHNDGWLFGHTRKKKGGNDNGVEPAD